MSTEELQKERRVSLGPVDVTVAMPLDLAETVRKHPVYRSLVRPTIGALGQISRLRQSPDRTSGHGRANGDGNGDGRHHPRDPLPPIPVVAPTPADLDPEGREIIERIAGQEWYHSMDLGHGVITPGFVDHRDQLAYYGLPCSMAGKRILDVATFDGYWAFEFERRGGEVVAADIARWTDLDVPRLVLGHPKTFGLDRATGSGFRLAREILGSKVERVECSVYDLDPERVGMFDLVFISDLLVHLEDPQLALQRARSVCRGEVIVADVYTPRLEGLGDHALAWFTAPGETWWLPNVDALKVMMRTAGFESIVEISRFVLQTSTEDTICKVVLRGSAHSGTAPSEASPSDEVKGPAAPAGRLVPAGHDSIRRQRTIRTGRIDLTVSVPLELADRLGSNVVGRRLLQPSAKAAGRADLPRPARRPVEPITSEARALWRRVAEIDWHDTIDLGLGVASPGLVDDRYRVQLFGLPESLVGKRVLDVAPFDGFWPFELERRGAEVVALKSCDADLAEALEHCHANGRRGAAGIQDGFALASEITGASITRTAGSIYHLNPEEIGSFDLVFMNEALLRLRCPARALESVATVCRGEVIVADLFAQMLEGLGKQGEGELPIAEYKPSNGTSWLPNVKALIKMMNVAGFEPVKEVDRFRTVPDSPTQKVVLRGTINRDPAWLQELRYWAERSPTKWKSAAEQLP